MLIFNVCVCVCAIIAQLTGIDSEKHPGPYES